MVKISDAQAGERFSSLERHMESLQRAVTELGVSTDLILEMQTDLTVLKDQTERLGTNMNTVQESLHRLERMCTRQFSNTREWDARGSRGNFAWNHSGIDRGRMEHRGKRLELPLFEGDDPFGWVFRADRYFAVNGIAEGEKVYAASVCLEGPALNWFQWVDSQTLFQSWREFPQEGNPTEQLLGIKQVSSVTDYRARFEKFATSSRGLPESVFRGAFLNGLREEIRSDVKLFRPADLQDAMTLAQEIEERNELVKKQGKNKMGRTWRSKNMGPIGKPKSGPSSMGELTSSPNFQQSRKLSFNPRSSIWQGATSTGTASQVVTHGDGRRDQFFRRLSESEYQQKRAKGLCFRCDEKFSPGHRGKNRQLQVLILSEDDSAQDVKPEEEDQPSPNSSQDSALDLSLNSLMGFTSSHTMKVWGLLGTRKIIILIDSGASHSFISSKLVREMDIPCEAMTGLGVQVGNEVVLGVTWLHTLGEVRADWSRFTMRFRQAWTWVTLSGDPTLCHSPVSLTSLNHSIHVEGYGILIEFFSVQREDVAGYEGQVADVIISLLDSFAEVFGQPVGLPPRRAQDHKIVLQAGAAPPNIRLYRYPQIQKGEIEKLVGEMLLSGIIRPSTSPYSSTVLLVKKKDGSWRFCVDYRALNCLTAPDKYLIPIIDELLDELYEATIFSKLDLKSGYHQIRVLHDDVPKTAFRTHEGHYEFLVMPFGLTNAPATFQSLMNSIFHPYLRKFVLVFFDDILVYSKDLQEHQIHLEIVLTTLLQESLIANRKKCVLAQPSLDYLGHIIFAEGVAADPYKVQAMEQWPTPKSEKEVRGFLGLTGYYRHFVKNYGLLARPLTKLLKKVGFHWGQPESDAFATLKLAMVSLPVLAMPNFDKLFVVESDASGTGIGAVLMQEGRPIAYFSRALSSSSRLKSVYERELMAIVLAVQKWRHFLLGRHFIIRTNQQSIRFIVDQWLVAPDQIRWVVKLLGYDFEVQYKT
ncbi:hypothetical protein UlMin_017223 [Ulmus minor]